jgi:hypothetical protein
LGLFPPFAERAAQCLGKSIELPGHLPDDGGEVQVAIGPDGTMPKFRTYEVEGEDGKQLKKVPEEQIELILDRARRKGRTAEVIDTEERSFEKADVRYKLTPDWLSFSAKVAVTTVSLVFEEQWLDTVGAGALQAAFWLASAPPGTLPKEVFWPLPESPSGDLGGLAPCEHLIVLEPTGNAPP